MNAGTCAHFWRGSCGESGVLQKIAVFSKYKMIIVNHSMCWSSVHMCSRTGPVIWPTQLIFILYFYIAGQSAGACCMLQPCVFNFVRTTLQKIIFSTFFFRKQPQRPTCAQKLVPRVVAIHVYSMTAAACTQARMTHPDRTRYPAWRWSREHPETERSTHRWLCLKTLFWQKRDQKLNFYQTLECTNEAETFTEKHVGWTTCADATIDSEFDI